MPLLRRETGSENNSAKGAYVLLEAEGSVRKLTLMATGSELHLAVEARELLQKEGIPTAVVSMPCRLMFEQQDAAYKRAVMGDTDARVAVEAAGGTGVGTLSRISWPLRGDGRLRRVREDRGCLREVDITTEAVLRAAHAVISEVGG
jgi:transketolase